MRMMIATAACLALCACNVSKEGNAVTVQYDENTAENAVADVSNTAQNIAADVSNDVSDTAAKVDNRVGDDDANDQANATENK